MSGILTTLNISMYMLIYNFQLCLVLRKRVLTQILLSLTVIGRTSTKATDVLYVKLDSIDNNTDNIVDSTLSRKTV